MTIRLANIVFVLLIAITVRGCVEATQHVQPIVLQDYEVGE